MRESRRLTVLVLLVTAVAGASRGRSIRRAAQARPAPTPATGSTPRPPTATTCRSSPPACATRRSASPRARPPATGRRSSPRSPTPGRPRGGSSTSSTGSSTSRSARPGSPARVGMTEIRRPPLRGHASTSAGSPGATARRGIDRVVLHELGHVVDHAIVPDDVMAGLAGRDPGGLRVRRGHRGRVRIAARALRRELREVGDRRHRPRPLHRLQGPAADADARRVGRAARGARPLTAGGRRRPLSSPTAGTCRSSTRCPRRRAPSTRASRSRCPAARRTTSAPAAVARSWWASMSSTTTYIEPLPAGGATALHSPSTGGRMLPSMIIARP